MASEPALPVAVVAPGARARRAGEFQILDYKIPRSAQPGGGEVSFMLTDRYGLPLSTTSTAARHDWHRAFAEIAYRARLPIRKRASGMSGCAVTETGWLFE
jgi:hypothetical protein